MNGNNNKKPDKNNNMPNKRNSIFIVLIISLVIWYLFSTVSAQFNSMTNVEKTYDEFIQMLEADNVSEVFFKYQDNKIEFKTRLRDNTNSEITYYTGYVSDSDLVPLLKDKTNVKVSSDVIDNETSVISGILSMFLPIILIYGAMWFVFRSITKNSGGVMGVGKSKAKVYVQKETGVTFKDVAGQEEAKDSLREIIDFLHNPDKYTRIGAKLPKGALLVGPPGTGKTLIAKAVAGEAKVPFFSLTGSDFVEMFVGVGASRVRDLFKQAQEEAPSIIFIDEIDAIGKSRDARYGGNDEREQTLNQLLSNMDGFDSQKGLVVIGATNRPEVLDKALLRPGRFDRRIIVDKPDLKGRVDILKVHAKNVLLHDSVDLEGIARATSGAAGADLANMINEAAILAVKSGRTVVTQEDLFESVEVVIAGKEKKDRVLSKEERKIVAYHEVGHALVTALIKHAEPVQKITIIPRTMGSLGYVMQVPEEEKYLMSKDEILTRIITLQGGRVAEEIVFDSITTGASNDIQKATKLARAMVTQFGMSDKFGMMGLEEEQGRYLDGTPVRNCSDQTSAEVDKEIMKILRECHQKARELLSNNRDVMDKIAEHLIDKETITGDEFMKIYREVKGIEITEDDGSDVIAEVEEKIVQTVEGAEKAAETIETAKTVEIEDKTIEEEDKEDSNNNI